MSAGEKKPPHGTPAAEVDIPADLVRRLLSEQAPEYAGRSITYFASGWDNVLYRLGDDLLVRLPRRELAVNLILNEQKWLPVLDDRLPITVPVPLLSGKPGCGYPWPWSIVRWVEGTTADLFPLISGQGRLFGHLLRALHVPAPEEAPLNPGRGIALATRAEKDLPRIERLALATGHIEPHHLDLWKLALDTPIDIEPCWIHGDLHMRNILVREGAVVSLLDWGDLAAGDPATDLASLWVLLESGEERSAFLEAYGPVSDETILRAKGWAFTFAVMMLDAGLVDNPPFARLGERMLRNLTIDA